MITTTTLLAWLGGMKEEERGRITELQYVREGKKGKEMLSFFGNWAEDLRETRSGQKEKTGVGDLQMLPFPDQHLGHLAGKKDLVNYLFFYQISPPRRRSFTPNYDRRGERMCRRKHNISRKKMYL